MSYPSGAHAYPGAIHIHTTASDGTGTIEQVIAAARAAGLRWMIITDHDTLDHRSYQGWHDDLLVIVGHEITPDHNHFLALNTSSVVDRDQHPQDFVDAVYTQGGFGIIAHPDERTQNAFKDIYRWDDWSVDGPRDRAGKPVGIELWNLMSDWGEHLTPRAKELLFLLPHLGLQGPTPDTLAWWDRLNTGGRRTFGIGGVDVHAFKRHVPWGELQVFDYQWTFGTLTNYLLLDQPFDRDSTVAINQVYAALAAGCSYFVNRLDGACPNLVFAAQRGVDQWGIGAEPSLGGGVLTLVADVGCDAELRVVRNGRVAVRALRALRHTIMQPGVYRLEAHRKGRPWLYSNPIYVTE